MSTPIVIQLMNDLSELERVSHLLQRFGEQHGLPPRAVFELNLALDEILTNVVSYAYADVAPHEIVLRLFVAVEAPAIEVLVEVEDDGQPFDPTSAPPPDINLSIEDRPIGGLGIHLVRQVMDELVYRRQHDRNVLSMRKLIHEVESET
jgi:anti-sigma regulatory factor (Ser/Thr protein kinase)